MLEAAALTANLTWGSSKRYPVRSVGPKLGLVPSPRHHEQVSGLHSNRAELQGCAAIFGCPRYGVSPNNNNESGQLRSKKRRPTSVSGGPRRQYARDCRSGRRRPSHDVCRDSVRVCPGVPDLQGGARRPLSHFVHLRGSLAGISRAGGFDTRIQRQVVWSGPALSSAPARLSHACLLLPFPASAGGSGTESLKACRSSI